MSLLNHTSRFLSRAIELFDSPDPVLILPYLGFANKERFFLKGRVMEDEGISSAENQSRYHNLRDSLRRFETDEIPGAKLSIQVGGMEYLAETDAEGFFSVNLPWNAPLPKDFGRWLPATVQIVELPGIKESPGTVGAGEVFFPADDASYGIISDIDDTVLQTHVTSRLRLKMLYTTLLMNHRKRLPMEGVPDLLRSLEKGADGLRTNPIFYVSDSPWNLYDLLLQFMTLHKLPKGPIVLRDIDMASKFRRKVADSPVHKLDSFRQIMNMYPDMKFIALGDTASKDADYYLQMAEEFSGRILAIYIRQTRNTANSRRIAKLIEQNSSINAVLINKSSEIFAHARGMGWLMQEGKLE